MEQATRQRVYRVGVYGGAVTAGAVFLLVGLSWFRGPQVVFPKAPADATPGVAFAYVSDYPPQYDVLGYDFLTRLEVFRPLENAKKAHSIGRKDGNYEVRWDGLRNWIEVVLDGKTLSSVSLEPVLRKLRATEGSEHKVPQKLLTVVGSTSLGSIMVYLDDVSGEFFGDRPVIHHFKADVLVTRYSRTSKAPRQSQRGNPRSASG